MKANDQLFRETGVHDEELHAAILKLGLLKDPEFLRIKDENMQVAAR